MVWPPVVTRMSSCAALASQSAKAIHSPAVTASHNGEASEVTADRRRIGFSREMSWQRAHLPGKSGGSAYLLVYIHSSFGSKRSIVGEARE